MKYKALGYLFYALFLLFVGLVLFFAVTGCVSRSRLCLGDCGHDYDAEKRAKLTAWSNAVAARQTKSEQLKRQNPERHFYFQGLARALEYAVKKYDHNWRMRKAGQAELDSAAGRTNPNKASERNKP